MKITKVLGNRVLVQVTFEEVKDTTESGLVMAPQSINPSYFEGVLVAKGRLQTIDLMSMKEGDKVAFTKYGYEDMGDGQYIVEENALLCVYE